MTTVRELIAHLPAFPPDVPVVIDMFSECDDLELDRVTLINAEDRKLIRCNGRYHSWYTYLATPDEKPEFVTVVHFPGN